MEHAGPTPAGDRFWWAFRLRPPAGVPGVLWARLRWARLLVAGSVVAFLGGTALLAATQLFPAPLLPAKAVGNWCVALLVLHLLTRWLAWDVWRLRMRRALLRTAAEHAHRVCLSCGYSLYACPPGVCTCPECGATGDLESIVATWKQYERRVPI